MLRPAHVCTCVCACCRFHVADPAVRVQQGVTFPQTATPDGVLGSLQTGTMMWRQIYTFAQAAMLNCLAHPWPVRIWAIAGADGV
jgi:hypothetical protein